MPSGFLAAAPKLNPPKDPDEAGGAPNPAGPDEVEAPKLKPVNAGFFAASPVAGAASAVFAGPPKAIGESAAGNLRPRKLGLAAPLVGLTSSPVHEAAAQLCGYGLLCIVKTKK